MLVRPLVALVVVAPAARKAKVQPVENIFRKAALRFPVFDITERDMQDLRLAVDALSRRFGDEGSLDLVVLPRSGLCSGWTRSPTDVGGGCRRTMCCDVAGLGALGELD
jgi:hypothetical protein